MFEVIFEPAHFNHAGAFHVADYWYFFNAAGIRQVFDNEQEALDRANENVN